MATGTSDTKPRSRSGSTDNVQALSIPNANNKCMEQEQLGNYGIGSGNQPRDALSRSLSDFATRVDENEEMIFTSMGPLTRFEKHKDEADLEQAAAFLQKATEFSPKSSHENRAASSALRLHARHKLDAVETEQSPVDQQASPLDEDQWTSSLQLLIRFQQSRRQADLQQAITVWEEMGRSTTIWDDHAQQASRLRLALSYHLDHLRGLSDLDETISRHREAVNLIPKGHPDKSISLFVLSNSLTARFHRLGELNDLEEAISTRKYGVNLIPHDHPDKPRHLNTLGNAFLTRFESLGESGDLDDALSRHRDAVCLTPDDHPDKSNHLTTLGNILFTRFQHHGESNDMEEAVSMHRNADDLTPLGHAGKPSSLNTLGTSLRVRFERLGNLADLEEAISKHRNAVDLTLHDDLDKPAFLNSLGNALSTRFERLGELNDIGEAISRHRDGLGLTPSGHPDMPVHLNSLGNSILGRFERVGEMGDLEEAIVRYSSAVTLTPEGHPEKPGRLNNLGISFYTRFERLGEISDLEEAISKQRNAVDLIPHGHPDRLGCLSNLANSLSARFRIRGEPRDLEEAISKQEDVVDLIPHDHPDNPAHLNGLANSFFVRFERFGSLRDLEEAMSRQKDAVGLIPYGHPEEPIYLNCLGNSFKARFESLGDLSDLSEAIARHKAAVDLTPRGPDKPGRLNNLANSLLTRFERVGDPSDLEEAVSSYRDAVDLTPHDDPYKHESLSNLGNSLLARFEHLKELSDLEQAISRHRDAIVLLPHGHPDKPACLNNLSTSIGARFQHIGELGDLEQAISNLKGVVGLTPDGHFNKPAYLNNLGDTLVTRFERLAELSDITQAISLYSNAASASTGPITIRFRASQKWISCARRIRDPSLLNAYSVTINLLPQLAWIGLPLSRRYEELARGTDVVREAAAAALDSGFPETAVEWLEQGRSIVWGELFQLRSSYEELSSVHPDHARRLRELSVALEHVGALHERSQRAEHHGDGHATRKGSLEQEADRHRMLAIDRDKLLQEIRRLPGFERFLLYKEFSQLRGSAHSGPVVILNAAENRCDALIVCADIDHVIHAPLPHFTFKRSTDLQRQLKSFVRHTRAIRSDEREGKSAAWDDVGWESLLSTLWKCVVKPVLDVLNVSTPGRLSRVFWCPTGPFVFLPIHAAGFYDAQYSQLGHKVFDFVVSSYVPTLGILMPLSSPAVASSGSRDLCFLAVRQPSSDGLPRLPGVQKEVEHIKVVIGDSSLARTTLLESSSGNVEQVLELMKKADWVHFACHGVQDAASPTDSGLCLADQRRLRISDMVALSCPRGAGGLAFLSACQTATGDEGLSDEAIHIAAGMLFAGYGGVIGTMWSISDTLAPRLARDVYEQLFQNAVRPDYRQAARALHDAVARLRDGGASFVEWLPFIHVGL